MISSPTYLLVVVLMAASFALSGRAQSCADCDKRLGICVPDCREDKGFYQKCMSFCNDGDEDDDFGGGGGGGSSSSCQCLACKRDNECKAAGGKCAIECDDNDPLFTCDGSLCSGNADCICKIPKARKRKDAQKAQQCKLSDSLCQEKCGTCKKSCTPIEGETGCDEELCSYNEGCVCEIPLSFPPTTRTKFRPRRRYGLRTAVREWVTNRTEALCKYGRIQKWDTSEITDMSHLFHNLGTFNDDISKWDTSRVSDMSNMFYGAESFDQPLGDWSTQNVSDMDQMFRLADSFNQPIGNWDTSAVRSMEAMFNSAKNFNQSIRTWDTAKVTTMDFMFSNSWSFNQPISNWNTASVKSMSYMFYFAKEFNQFIGKWDMASVTTMTYMLFNANDFDQNLSDWCINPEANIYKAFQGSNCTETDCGINFDGCQA